MCKLINERNEQLSICGFNNVQMLTKNCSNYHVPQYLLIIIHVYDRLQLITNMSGDIFYFVLTCYHVVLTLYFGIENRSVKTFRR